MPDEIRAPVPADDEDLQLDASGPDEIRSVTTVVVALIPAFNQVRVVDDEGRHYAITRATKGVDITQLIEGQRVQCTVTVKMPRVLAVAVLAA